MIQRFDGMWMGSGNPMDPTIYEVFDPPWWRVDRWFRWLFTRQRKGILTIGGRSVRSRAVGRPTRA
jgi:hypothetical protein